MLNELIFTTTVALAGVRDEAQHRTYRPSTGTNSMKLLHHDDSAILKGTMLLHDCHRYT